jgi:hypothetical protein
MSELAREAASTIARNVRVTDPALSLKLKQMKERLEQNRANADEEDRKEYNSALHGLELEMRRFGDRVKELQRAKDRLDVTRLVREQLST